MTSVHVIGMTSTPQEPGRTLVPLTDEDEVDRARRERFTDFMLNYKFAIAEVVTKIEILRDDFNNDHEYNPIEHINSRLKKSESILEKLDRKHSHLDERWELDHVRANILDIAGVRVTCSFIADIYKIRDTIVGQEDVTLLAERDYIASPKENGYQSLHLIVEIPVFRAREAIRVPVEIQIRTIAMDFWASLEHKIYYKYAGAVPETLKAELAQAADAANRLDRRMEQLHEQVRTSKR
ncbi:MAG: GTP pyrophosphokinase family protein [Leifsonia sp.]